MREGVGSFCPYWCAKWSLWGGGRNFRKEPEYRAKIGKYGEKLCQGRKKRDSGAKGAQIPEIDRALASAKLDRLETVAMVNMRT